jgi:hypothetical protein
MEGVQKGRRLTYGAWGWEAAQVTQVADRVTAPEAVDPEDTATSTAVGRP